MAVTVILKSRENAALGLAWSNRALDYIARELRVH